MLFAECGCSVCHAPLCTSSHDLCFLIVSGGRVVVVVVVAVVVVVVFGSAFGGTYTWLRRVLGQDLPDELRWTSNMAAAAVATVVSGPFNLARNVQYGTKSRQRRPSVGAVLRTLADEVAERRGLGPKMTHVQQRLRVGWGTARVAAGMAFAHQVYDWLVANSAAG